MMIRCALLVPLVLVVSLASVQADEPFDYYVNSCSVIGLKDYRNGTPILPDNRFQLIGDGSFQRFLRLRFGSNLRALSRDQTKTLLEGWLPVVLLSAEDGPVRYDFVAWATPLPSVKDWQKAFDWPSEGENYLNWIRVSVMNTGTQAAQAAIRAELVQLVPGKVNDSTPLKGVETVVEEPLAESWSLAPGQRVERLVRIPFAPLKERIALDREDPKIWLDRTIAYWRGVMGRAAKFEVPCRKASDAMKASLVYQLIDNDLGSVHAGEQFYDRFYLRDGAYQVMHLEEAGLDDVARKAIDVFLKYQYPNGQFCSQSRQLDGNGQAQWALWQYYLVSRDRDWLERAYPQMRRAAQWSIKARGESPSDSPFAGVLPGSFADGEVLYDGKHHIVGYDFWNLRGMLCTAQAAQVLGRNVEARELFQEATAYREAINAAWMRTTLSHFPPSWECSGAFWGNTETLWPTALFDASDPRVKATIEYARLRLNGGFLEGIIQWGRGAMHLYMSTYTTLASLICDEHEHVAEDFYWYLLHSTATHGFAETISGRHANSNKIPHGLGAANYAILFRHMLIHESGDELHLLPAIPDWWLGEGQEVRVERAATHFGPMELTLRGQRDGVRAEITLPQRNPAKRVVLHLPRSRTLLTPIAGIEVQYRADQQKRWDYPTVLELYRQRCQTKKPDVKHAKKNGK